MKKFLLIIFTIVLTFCSVNIFGQKSSASPSRKKVKSLVKPLPKAKIEVEDWKDFESKDLRLKMSFPKEPTLTVTGKVSYDWDAVKSSIAQTYINGNFYMVEVREYRDDFLPDRLDLSKNYGEWLKTYVLPETEIISEKTFEYEYYKVVEFTYQQTETDVLFHRAIVVGRNLYQMIVQLEIKKPDDIEKTRAKNEEKIKKFFDSFEITEKNLNKSEVY